MSVYIRKDHWTSTEDKIVRAAVMKYGTNQWSRVASLLARKSATQCKRRWNEHLSPRISQALWSALEDQKLLELERSMPNMWRSIGATLGGRTAAQCHERWLFLQDKGDSASKDLLDELDYSNESDASEPGSDSEKQMMAEATARLSNSLGRKAKRKQRERLDADETFAKSIAEHRTKKTAILVKRSSSTLDYNDGIPFDARPDRRESSHFVNIPAVPQRQQPPNYVSAITRNRAPRLPGRPKLNLPEPTAPTSVHDFEYQLSIYDRERISKLLAELAPPETGNSLLSLARDSPDEEFVSDYGIDDAAPLGDTERSVSLDVALKSDDTTVDISDEARALLEEEMAGPTCTAQTEPELPDIDLSSNSEKYFAVRRQLVVSVNALAQNASRA